MVEEKNKLLSDVSRLVEELRAKFDIKEVYLFGSYAWGNPDIYSDVDIAVVVGSSGDGGIYDGRFEIFHEVQKHNSSYEVLCFDKDEFEEDFNPIVKRIKQNGIRIL